MRRDGISRQRAIRLFSPGVQAAHLNPNVEEQLGRLDNPLKIVNAWSHSRNTILLRLKSEADGATYIGKLYRAKSIDFIVHEYAVLLDLQKTLIGTGVRALIPYALLEDVGLMITAEEHGSSLQQLIQRGNSRRTTDQSAMEIHAFLEKAAAGIYHFHSAYGLKKNNRDLEESRLYLDYCPANVMITDGVRREVVLLDPPEREEHGSVHNDLGTFCFELSRIGLRPNRVIGFKHSSVPRFKKIFVNAYFELLGRAITAHDIDAVKEAERTRARAARSWYYPFWRYEKPWIEFARAAWFVPIITLYASALLERTYKVGAIAKHDD
jgi:hypothetical protein